jgi:hypothetical protein
MDSFLLGGMNMMLLFGEPLFAVAASVNEISDFFNSTATSVTDETIPKALTVMWGYALNGSLYKMSCGLGLFAAVFGVGFWSLKFYRALQEGTLLPVVNEVVWPLLVVLLLANGGATMRGVTFGAKDIVNNINRSMHRVVDLDVSYQKAFQVLARSSVDGYLMQSLYSSCEANIDQTKLAECLATGQALMDARLNGRFSSILNSTKPELTAAVNNINKSQKDEFNQKLARAKKPTDKGSVAEAAGTATPNNLSQVFNASRIVNGRNPGDLTFQKSALAFRKAFMYLLEIFMLVLALVAPIFVGLSMFPVGTKPLVSWATLFLAAGFCKICYTLVAGLSAVAMVLTENTDMFIFGIIVGGLAPILSVTITSILAGSFSGAIGAIAYPAQNYGVNAGLTSGAPKDQPQDTNNASKIDGGGNK